MGPPLPDGAMRHPGGKHSRRPHHSVDTAAVNSLFPERAQHNGASIRIFPHLTGSQPEYSFFLLSRSPPGTHHGDTGTQNPHRTIPPHHYPIIVRPIKRATMRDVGTSPPCNGSGLDFQGRIQGAPRSMVPCGHHNPGSPSWHKTLCEIVRTLTWTRRASNPSNGNMGSPY